MFECMCVCTKYKIILIRLSFDCIASATGIIIREMMLAPCSAAWPPASILSACCRLGTHIYYINKSLCVVRKPEGPEAQHTQNKNNLPMLQQMEKNCIYSLNDRKQNGRRWQRRCSAVQQCLYYGHYNIASRGDR